MTSGRRIKSLLRLRNARITLRNAAGARLAEAELAVKRAAQARGAAIRAAEVLAEDGVERFRRARAAAELLLFNDERETALGHIVAAEAAYEGTLQVADGARQVLARCEQELRRVERVLSLARRERQVAENRAEQLAHDDLTNHRLMGEELAREET